MKKIEELKTILSTKIEEETDLQSAEIVDVSHELDTYVVNEQRRRLLELLKDLLR